MEQKAPKQATKAEAPKVGTTLKGNIETTVKADGTVIVNALGKSEPKAKAE